MFLYKAIMGDGSVPQDNKLHIGLPNPSPNPNVNPNPNINPYINPNVNSNSSSLMLKMAELRSLEMLATKQKPSEFESAIRNIKHGDPISPPRDFIAEMEALSLAEKKDDKSKTDEKKKESFFQKILHQLQDLSHELKIDGAIKQVYQEKISQLKKMATQLIEEEKKIDKMTKEQLVEACYLGKRYSVQLGVMLNDILKLVEDELTNKFSIKKMITTVVSNTSKYAAEMANMLPEHEAARHLYNITADYLTAVSNSANQLMRHCEDYLTKLQTKIDILKKPNHSQSIIPLPKDHTASPANNADSKVDSKAAAFNRKKPVSLKFTSSATKTDGFDSLSHCTCSSYTPTKP